MKKLLIALVILGAPALAMANHYGESGCGFGSMMMGPDGNQVLSVTTNGSSGSQTFGISTGTLNCTEHGGSAKAVDDYVEANRVALASEASRGQGTTIASLSQVMGCRDSAVLGRVMQSNYDVLFPTADVESSRVSETLRKLRTQDQSLAQACAG